MTESDSPWYAKGLRFECTGCGKCCTGAPGYVWVDETEIEEIARFLKLSVQEFSKRYLRRVEGHFSLLEHSKTFDCVFLKDKKCQIYAVRPTQCRTYPWWPKNLKSEEDWNKAALFCEGIHDDAQLIQLKTIEEQQSFLI